MSFFCYYFELEECKYETVTMCSVNGRILWSVSYRRSWGDENRNAFIELACLWGL